MVSKHRYMTTKGLRDIGLGHSYCGEIDTNVIAWYRSLGTLIPRSSWDGLDHCMYGVFHVVFGCVKLFTKGFEPLTPLCGKYDI